MRRPRRMRRIGMWVCAIGAVALVVVFGISTRWSLSWTGGPRNGYLPLWAIGRGAIAAGYYDWPVSQPPPPRNPNGAWQWDRADPSLPLYWRPQIMPGPPMSHVVVIPIWIPTSLLALLAALLLWSSRGRGAGRCPRCGYSLAGLAAGSPCPECGPKPGSSVA